MYGITAWVRSNQAAALCEEIGILYIGQVDPGIEGTATGVIRDTTRRPSDNSVVAPFFFDVLNGRGAFCFRIALGTARDVVFVAEPYVPQMALIGLGGGTRIGY